MSERQVGKEKIGWEVGGKERRNEGNTVKTERQEKSGRREEKEGGSGEKEARKEERRGGRERYRRRR